MEKLRQKQEILKIITELFVDKIQQDVLFKHELELETRGSIDEVDIALYRLQKALNKEIESKDQRNKVIWKVTSQG